MEWYEVVYDQISNYVNIPYLLLFMFLAYMIKKYFETALSMFSTLVVNLVRKLFKKPPILLIYWKTVYSVFVLATIIGLLFYFFIERDWVKLGISYAVGTSLHELVFRWLESKFEK